MISTNDMRAGQAILFEGRICLVADYQRVKPGKGPTFVKVKLKDVNTGQVLDHTWRGEQKVELAILQSRTHQYLYGQGDLYHFMDLENYEQVALARGAVADILPHLKENMEVEITFHKGKVVKVNLPAFVELKVAETAPGVRGDTVSGTTKPATLETGAVIQVPLFIGEGELIRVDTRTGAYVTRV